MFSHKAAYSLHYDFPCFWRMFFSRCPVVMISLIEFTKEIHTFTLTRINLLKKIIVKTNNLKLLEGTSKIFETQFLAKKEA